jgi:hypothetical protein
MPPKTTEFVINTNMVVVPPNDSTLQQCVSSKGNHKWYSTALRKMSSMVLLKCGKSDGNAVYVPKETILKEMAAKIDEVKPAFIFLT